MSKKINLIIICVISFFYLFLRIYNLESLITFHLDQGLQLNEAHQMIQNRHINLVGPMVTTKIFEGRGFFIGPFYTYSLAFLGIISQWNPLVVTFLLIIIEYLSLLLFINWLYKKNNKIPINILFIVIATTPFLIEHSRFFWNPHFLLPLSYLLIYFLENKKYFLSAIILGLGFSFHYSAVLWGFPILYYLIKNHEKIKKYLIFIPGFLIGDLPFFIFEIKHNFYNIRTMFLVFTNTNKAGEMSPYYFVFPFAAFIIFFLLKTYYINKKIFYSLIFIIISFNIFYKIKLQEKIPIGMPKGWNYIVQNKIKNKITEKCPLNYNIATTISGDTRAYDMRYLLTTAKCPPMSVHDYPNSETIFLIAPSDRPPENESVWEISSFKPFKVTSKEIINDDIIFYRLDKE